MAERRMFAKTIVDSDAFLEMPSTSQLLYFHLAMRADDDGFVNKPKTILRMTGSKEDDLRILIGRKFVIPFESGVLVIKHWKIHNYIQSDRYNETKYKQEKSMLCLDENKAYKVLENHMDTQCIHDVHEMDSQVRLGKDSIGKDSKENICAFFNEFWLAYPKKVDKEKAQRSFAKLKVDQTLFDLMIKAIESQKKSKQWSDKQFIPMPTTWLNNRRWEAELGEATQEEPTGTSGRYLRDNGDGTFTACTR